MVLPTAEIAGVINNDIPHIFFIHAKKHICTQMLRGLVKLVRSTNMSVQIYPKPSGQERLSVLVSTAVTRCRTCLATSVPVLFTFYLVHRCMAMP